EVQIRLTQYAEKAKVLNAWNTTHHVDNLCSFVFERVQIVGIKLDIKFAFHTADRLLDVVRDRLRKIPNHSGNFGELTVHCGNQFFFVLAEHRTPLFFEFEIHKVFGVEE